MDRVKSHPKVVVPEGFNQDALMKTTVRRGVEEMWKIFLKLKEEGKAILLVSHNKEDISILCDKVYEIHDGELRMM